MNYEPNSITETPGGYVIYPYKKGQCKSLEYITSYLDKPRHKVVEYTGFYNSKDHVFVTHSGIEKEYLRNYFPDYHFVTQPLIQPKSSKRFNFKSEVFDTQSDIRSRLRYQCISSLFNQTHLPRSFIKVQTGFGKTAIALEFLSLRGKKALINCYSSKVLQQFWDSLSWMTNIDIDNRVRLIKSSATFISILNDDYDVDNTDIYLCTTRLLQQFASNHGWNLLNIIFEKMGIGTRIMDEVHRHVKSNIFIDAYTSIQKTVYMTADLHKSRYEKNRQFLKIFSKIPIIAPSAQFEDSSKYIDIVINRYNSKPGMEDILGIMKRGEFSIFEFIRYEFRKGILKDAMLSTISSILKIEKDEGLDESYKLLILVSLTEIVDLIYDILNEEYPDIMIGKYHGKLTQEIRNQAFDSKIIVSTYSSFGVGVDCANIRYVLCLEPVTEIDDNQASGRIRPLSNNLNGAYFMFIDSGFEYTEKTLSRRIQYLQKCGKAKNILKISHYSASK